jgi:hypothetical protein
VPVIEGKIGKVVQLHLWRVLDARSGDSFKGEKVGGQRVLKLAKLRFSRMKGIRRTVRVREIIWEASRIRGLGPDMKYDEGGRMKRPKRVDHLCQLGVSMIRVNMVLLRKQQE